MATTRVGLRAWTQHVDNDAVRVNGNQWRAVSDGIEPPKVADGDGSIALDGSGDASRIDPSGSSALTTDRFARVSNRGWRHRSKTEAWRSGGGGFVKVGKTVNVDVISNNQFIALTSISTTTVILPAAADPANPVRSNSTGWWQQVNTNAYRLVGRSWRRTGVITGAAGTVASDGSGAIVVTGSTNSYLILGDDGGPYDERGAIALSGSGDATVAAGVIPATGEEQGIVIEGTGEAVSLGSGEIAATGDGSIGFEPDDNRAKFPEAIANSDAPVALSGQGFAFIAEATFGYSLSDIANVVSNTPYANGYTLSQIMSVLLAGVAGTAFGFKPQGQVYNEGDEFGYYGVDGVTKVIKATYRSNNRIVIELNPEV